MIQFLSGIETLYLAMQQVAPSDYIQRQNQVGGVLLRSASEYLGNGLAEWPWPLMQRKNHNRHRFVGAR
jgi:hypothetical protein